MLYQLVVDFLVCVIGIITGAYFCLILTVSNVFILSMVSSAEIFDGIFGISFISLGFLMLSKIYRKKKATQLQVNLQGKDADFEQNKSSVKALFDQFKLI